MNIIGNIVLSDSSRHLTDSGNSGFFFNVAPIDSDTQTSIIYDSLTLTGDQTFLQQQIVGPGDLTLILRDWTYFGGYPLDATTFTGGAWMYRWFDPSYIKYSVWYLDYDSSQFSLVDYRQRTPVEQSVGNFYAPMVTPRTPGHYQIRWLYTKTEDSYGHQIAQPFTAVSRGLDAMRDYPYPAGSPAFPFGGTDATDIGALIQTLPVYEYKNIGDTALFTLQFNAAPPSPISFLWRMGGDAIYDGTKFSGVTTDTLSILDLNVEDGGVYNCVVSNQVYSTNAFLIIDPP